MKLDRSLTFTLDQSGEFARLPLCAALRKFDEDVADLFILLRQVHTAKHIGCIFTLGEQSRGAARCLRRKRIDAGSRNLALCARAVGME